MAFTLVSSASGVGSVTLNTTGAKLLCVIGGMDAGATLSDNQTNTYTLLTQTIGTSAASPNANATRTWWIKAPTVAASHTITISQSYAAVCVLAFSSDQAAANIVLDGEATGAGVQSATSLLAGSSLTPTAAWALFISGVCLGGAANSPSINGGFTIPSGASVNGIAGTSYGAGAAYLNQSTTAAARPTWAWASTAGSAVSLAVFRDGSAPPSGTSTTLSGPSGGASGVASGNFTVGVNGTISGTLTVTPNDSTGGGTFLPTSVAISNTTPTATFTYTPASTGVKTISITNSGTLTNPAGISYTSTGTVTLNSATIASHGGAIVLTFSGVAVPSASDFTVTSAGYPMVVSAVSGSGASWTASLGKRWIRAGATVTVRYQSGSAVTATNSSAVTDDMVKHTGRKFGMFLHFGVNTFNNVEWSSGTLSASSFAPSANISTGIDSWISGARLAGMRYCIMTSKHHDGFCLWPNAANNYGITQSSWWSGAGSPDIVGLFTQKCRAANLGVGLYFSIWDRKWEANNPSGTSADYIAHCQAHLTDLLTKNGPIDLIWLDGWNWLDGLTIGQPNFDRIPFASIYNHIKSLQPNCQVLLNLHDYTLQYTDVVVFEMGQTGGTGASPANLFPGETCDTIRVDHKWFWGPSADVGLSASVLNSSLTLLNSYRSGYLLNCPPDTTGALPSATLATLAAVGVAELEAAGGSSAVASNSNLRTFSLTLTTDGTAPVVNATGLRWAVYETANPGLHARPVAQGVGATNGSGVFSGSFYSRLTAGAVVWLAVTTSDGTTTQSPASKAFSAPVVVS